MGRGRGRGKRKAYSISTLSLARALVLHGILCHYLRCQGGYGEEADCGAEDGGETHCLVSTRRSE